MWWPMRVTQTNTSDTVLRRNLADKGNYRNCTGTPLRKSLGGVNLRKYSGENPNLLEGYVDYYADFTDYILNIGQHVLLGGDPY
jgi:hypothetical protein